MNVYDFDKTIFYPDSSATFCKWYYKKHPEVIGKILSKAAVRYLATLVGTGTTAQMKEVLFSFLSNESNIDEVVEQFWDEHWDNIQKWYLNQKKEDDIIISASPEFFLQKAAERLNVRLIATNMDKHTGKITGGNCHDKEKVIRFYAEYPDAHIDEFYSDSFHDTPMAMEADKAFMVKKENVFPWPQK